MLNNGTDNRETHDSAFYRPSNAPLSPSTGQSCGNLREGAIWLAAALDGEGHFNLGLFHSRNGFPCGSPQIIVVNCNEEFIQKAAEVMFQITKRKPLLYFSKRLAPHHSIWRLRINDQKSIRKVCEATLPYLTAKRSQAELLRDFCLVRKAKKHSGNSAYDEQEFEIMARMNQARHDSYGSSEGAATTERADPVN
jgi:hypothetical protein